MKTRTFAGVALAVLLSLGGCAVISFYLGGAGFSIRYRGSTATARPVSSRSLETYPGAGALITTVEPVSMLLPVFGLGMCVARGLPDSHSFTLPNPVEVQRSDDVSQCLADFSPGSDKLVELKPLNYPIADVYSYMTVQMLFHKTTLAFLGGGTTTGGELGPEISIALPAGYHDLVRPDMFTPDGANSYTIEEDGSLTLVIRDLRNLLGALTRYYYFPELTPAELDMALMANDPEIIGPYNTLVLADSKWKDGIPQIIFGVCDTPYLHRWASDPTTTLQEQIGMAEGGYRFPENDTYAVLRMPMDPIPIDTSTGETVFTLDFDTEGLFQFYTGADGVAYTEDDELRLAPDFFYRFHLGVQ